LNLVARLTMHIGRPTVQAHVQNNALVVKPYAG